MRFLIQTIDGEVVHDFSFTLIEAIRYQKWLGRDMSYEFYNMWTPEERFGWDRPRGMIPVGTIEFVLSYYSEVEMKDINLIRPINLPECFNPRVCKIKDFDGKEPEYHIKSTTKFKDPMNGIRTLEEIKSLPPESMWQISELEFILSEYRVFVRDGVILGCHFYSGEDPLIFPDGEEIKRMVKTYTNAPSAYTLDVMVTLERKTKPIEVHEFFSCGLYGFADLKNLPWMFIRTWQAMMNKK